MALDLQTAMVLSYMTTPVVTVGASAPLTEAQALMISHGITVLHDAGQRRRDLRGRDSLDHSLVLTTPSGLWSSRTNSR